MTIFFRIQAIDWKRQKQKRMKFELKYKRNEVEKNVWLKRAVTVLHLLVSIITKTEPLPATRPLTKPILWSKPGIYTHTLTNTHICMPTFSLVRCIPHWDFRKNMLKWNDLLTLICIYHIYPHLPIISPPVRTSQFLMDTFIIVGLMHQMG